MMYGLITDSHKSRWNEGVKEVIGNKENYKCQSQINLSDR